MGLATKLIVTVCITASSSCVWAFDDDISINMRNFKNENFIDIKAYQFRQSLQQQWYDTENGFRITAGSLDVDRLTLQSELRLKHSLSDSVDVRLHHEEESFYGLKPYARPLLELATHPWQTPLEFSLLASPAYDKRQADLGFAIAFGLRPRNYLRFSWLEQDYYYNEKNAFDSSRYQQSPQVLGIEGDYWFGERLRSRFLWQESKPVTLLNPDENLVFEHRSKQLNLTLDYHYQADSLFGLHYNGFEVDKALQDTQQDRSQVLGFDSIDVYWTRFFATDDELTLGSQFDDFDNQLRDVISAGEQFDYTFSTWQVYGTFYHNYSANAAWDLGLYIGDTKEAKNFLQADKTDGESNSIEAKLRTSWEYHSLDRKGVLIIHFGFNLDNLANDPGDGGGISYQVVF